ncbi:YSC84-related protein [Gammaproteobacteria bacterium]|jgi:lipid-binding SYLF domain-containing protein|nr:YSC84-related protein [Gammaproteobacteria bacterium]
MKKLFMTNNTALFKGFLILTILNFSMSFSNFTFAKNTIEIDAAIESALTRFTDEITGSQAFLDGARGTLVIPRMIKAGVILGMEYGEGALIVDGIKVQYYRAFSTSLGIQLGVGAKDLVILFFDDDAMDDFLYSSGWQAGVDGTVALWNMGAGGSIDTTESQDPIVGFVFGHKGIIAGLSMEGTKFTKIWPDSEGETDEADIEEFNETALD